MRYEVAWIFLALHQLDPTASKNKVFFLASELFIESASSNSGLTLNKIFALDDAISSSSLTKHE